MDSQQKATMQHKYVSSNKFINEELYIKKHQKNQKKQSRKQTPLVWTPYACKKMKDQQIVTQNSLFYGTNAHLYVA